MNYFYNSQSIYDRQSQWKSYLGKKQKQFVTDISKVVEQQTRDYHQALKTVSNQQAAAMERSAEVISGSFEAGLEHVAKTFKAGLGDVARGIGKVESSISELGGILDWGLTMMIEQQQLSNLLSENIALLLRIPDFQKERQYYIEQGLKHCLNAAKDEDLYRDALKNLLKAETLEEADYIVLYHIGWIYLYGSALIDLPRAETYLRKAAKYAVAEADPKAARVANILAGDPRKRLSTQVATTESMRRLAAKCYWQGGRACYVQGKLPESVELYERAFTLNPQLLDASFDQAKALAAWGREEKAAHLLKPVIEADRTFALKTVADADLSPKPAVQRLLADLRNGAFLEAERTISSADTLICQLGEAIGKVDSLNFPTKKAREYQIEAEEILSDAKRLKSQEAYLPLDEATVKANKATENGREGCKVLLKKTEISLNEEEHHLEWRLSEMKERIESSVDSEIADRRNEFGEEDAQMQKEIEEELESSPADDPAGFCGLIMAAFLLWPIVSIAGWIFGIGSSVSLGFSVSIIAFVLIFLYFLKRSYYLRKTRKKLHEIGELHIRYLEDQRDADISARFQQESGELRRELEEVQEKHKAFSSIRTALSSYL